jgi:hypothetical protein
MARPSTPTLSRTTASLTPHPKVHHLSIYVHSHSVINSRPLPARPRSYMSASCSARERAAVQGPGDRGSRRLLLHGRRQAGRHEQQPLRVLGLVRAHPRPEHAGPVARTCGRRTRRRVAAALQPVGPGDGRGAGRRRLLRLCDVVPGEQALRQGAAQGRRLHCAAGARPLPLQQRHGARRAVRHAQQPEPRPGVNR